MIITTLSAELKSHTQAAHLQLEDAVIPYIKKIGSKADYVHLLKIFYGFYAPLEEKLSDCLSSEIMPDLSRRRKAASILHDIKLAGGSDGNFFRCSVLPKVSTPSQAMGAAYVLEGSTLGGRAIAGMIGKILPDATFHFFQHYGEETKRMWESFKSHLDENPSLERDPLLKAANETFVLFKKWIDEYPRQ